jgi:flagellar transcriptional activator FlhD
MRTNELMNEIHDINLNYLLLSQNLIREDKDMAIVRLGISQEIAEMIENLSTAQLMKLAGGSTLITRFRFDDVVILGMLTHDKKPEAMAHSHSAILMAKQEVKAIC